jgi:hypothetical protein
MLQFNLLNLFKLWFRSDATKTGKNVQMCRCADVIIGWRVMTNPLSHIAAKKMLYVFNFEKPGMALNNLITN